nr:hypothetical protein Iba_chr14fCG5490 [Ipomoea batatas]
MAGEAEPSSAAMAGEAEPSSEAIAGEAEPSSAAIAGGEAEQGPPMEYSFVKAYDNSSVSVYDYPPVPADVGRSIRESCRARTNCAYLH